MVWSLNCQHRYEGKIKDLIVSWEDSAKYEQYTPRTFKNEINWLGCRGSQRKSEAPGLKFTEYVAKEIGKGYITGAS